MTFTRVCGSIIVENCNLLLFDKEIGGSEIRWKKAKKAVSDRDKWLNIADCWCNLVEENKRCVRGVCQSLRAHFCLLSGNCGEVGADLKKHLRVFKPIFKWLCYAI